MTESSTYQAILRRGEAVGIQQGKKEEARRLPLLQGTKRFGAPPAEIRARVEVAEVEQTEVWLLRLLDNVSSWEELLQ